MADSRDPKKLSKERFAQFADRYVASFPHSKGEDLARLVEIAKPQPNWAVLDIATGGGHTALKFAPYVRSVIASDLTQQMLAAAEAFIREQGTNNIEFRQADAEDLPFEDRQFDLVTCRIAAHHFPNAAQFVLESGRTLKPGGLLLVQDMSVPEDEQAAREIDAFERLRDPSHNRMYATSEWEAMYRQAGLELTHRELIIKTHPLLAWAERQGNGPEVIAELRQMVDQASDIAKAWMQPKAWDTPQAAFTGRHLLIAGRKIGH